MRIVSWNCNGGFRNKYKRIISLEADVYVIQECENPEFCNDSAYKEFSKNSIWTGENNSKGLGVFIRTGLDYINNYWPNYGLRNFISVYINHEFNLLGVWACKPYIEEFYVYQNINNESLDENTIIIGDLNSNSIWDKQHGRRNHSTVVKALEDKNLLSAYHYMRHEDQGKETEKTFFLYRQPSRAYHIDYCFLAPKRIVAFDILDKQNWLAYSDHVPIIAEIK